MNLDSPLPTPQYQRPIFDTTTQGLLRDAINTFAANRGSAIGKVQRLRLRDPMGVFLAAVQLLEAAEENSRTLEDAVGLLGTCSLLAELFMNAQVWSLESAVGLAQKLHAVDPRLDVRLVKQVLGKVGSVGSIKGDEALRLLGLIDATSDCSVLAAYLIQFQRHPNDRVRSKAALMLGRSNCNPGRVELLLSSSDDRIRANAVQSLWGQRSKAARQIFWNATQDRCARVVANALLGLCRAGEEEALLRLAELAEAADPAMRCSGAWAMGETSDQRFFEKLEMLVQDPFATVRERAQKSRQKLAAQIPVAAPETKAEPIPVVSIKAEEPEHAEPVEEAEGAQPDNNWLTGEQHTTYERIA